MQSDGGKLKTWLKVADGPGVKNHGADIGMLATIYQNIQWIFDSIGESKYGKDYKKEDCRLFVSEIQEGSVVSPLYPQTYAPRIIDGIEDPFLNITGSLDRLLFTLNNNPENFKVQLEEEIQDPIARMNVLRYITNISKTGAAVSVKSATSRPAESYSLPRKNDSLVSDLLNNYKTSGIETVQGVVVNFSGDPKNYYFSIRAKNHRLIKCYYDKKDEKRIKSLYKKRVLVTGEIRKTSRSYTVQNIITLEEQLTEELTSVGIYSLKKPIRFYTSYDEEENLWGMVNEELALYGYGETYHKTIRSLEEELEGHVLSFTEIPDEEHSESSLQLKKDLADYIDLEEVSKKINEKYGEE